MIKKLSEGKWLVDFQPRRHAPRVRRTVYGSKSLAEHVLSDLRLRTLAEQFGWPQPSDTTVKQLIERVTQDYSDNSRKSLKSAHQIGKFWKDWCGGKRAEDITGEMLKDWAREWIAGGLSPARCNRRIRFLLRGYTLGIKSDPPLISRKPAWKDLAEAKPRSGFREWDEFVKIRQVLPEHARIPVTIEYWTGMRSGEVHSLQWPQVRFDHKERVVYIHLPDSKSGEPRLVAMSGDLYDTLWSWRRRTQSRHPNCFWVCQYRGRHCRSIRTAWMTACVRVGLGRWRKPHEPDIGKRGFIGPRCHDFRRTAVRNLIRARVPDKLAMQISGHKTRSVFERYNIISERDLVEAGRAVVEEHRKREGRRPVDTSNEPQRRKPRQPRRS